MQSLNTFKRWWTYQLRTYDCDPQVYAIKYLVARMELNIEQKYWLCWLFGNTYQLPTAWVMFNEFPDYENADYDRMKAWEEKNKGKLPYQKDRKWQVGQLAENFKSYREFMGGLSQEDRLTGRTFQYLHNEVDRNMRGFGRFAIWNYFQLLEAICDCNLLKPNKLFFGESSAKAIRNGMCRVLGKDDWVDRKNLSNVQISFLENQAYGIFVSVRDKFTKHLPVIPPTMYTLETSLCSFGKLFRVKQGRYLGYYLDRFADDINDTATCGWPGINWDLLWECRDEILLPELNNATVDTAKMRWFMETGKFYNNLYPSNLLDKLDGWYNKHNYDH